MRAARTTMRRRSNLIAVSTIGLALALLWLNPWGSFRLHSRSLRYTLGPDLKLEDMALSPDGRRLAILEQWTGMPETAGNQNVAAQQDRVAILDTASDRQIATIFPPPGDWNQGKQLPVDQPLRYCDNGRYILAFVGRDTLFAFRTSDYGAQTAIRLGGIPPRGTTPAPAAWDAKDKQHPSLRFGQLPVGPPPQFDVPGVHSQVFYQGGDMFFGFQIDCAKASPFLVISANGVVRVINLDSGENVADVGNALKHYFFHGSTAISPDGSRVAVIELNSTWRHGTQVSVADVRTGQRIYSEYLGFPDGEVSTYQLVFAGNHTLLAAEKPRGSTDYDGNGPAKGEMPGEPTDQSGFLQNTIWALDLDAGGKKREFSQLGRRACGYIDASADGKILLGRSRVEFRHHRDLGSVLDVVRDRFVFWNLESGRQIAESPSLPIEQSFLYPFLDLDTGGWFLSFPYYQYTPEIRMSDDGRTAISYMGGKDEIRLYHWN